MPSHIHGSGAPTAFVLLNAESETEQLLMRKPYHDASVTSGLRVQCVSQWADHT